MVHRGKLLREKILESGINISEVAKKAGLSRQHMYNLFERYDVSIDVILRIGKIIHYDFTSDIPQLKKMVNLNIIEEPTEKYVTQKEFSEVRQVITEKDEEIRQFKESIRLRDEKIQSLELEIRKLKLKLSEKKMKILYTS